jgi:hypothetical protein
MSSKSKHPRERGRKPRKIVMGDGTTHTVGAVKKIKLTTGQTVVAGVRSTLVDYFTQKADYRASLVERVPWDARKNSGYAQSLTVMAEYIAGLPDDDPTLTALAACQALYDPDIGFDLPRPVEGHTPEYDASAVHCGPRGSSVAPADCIPWFKEWSAGLIAEAEDIAAANERFRASMMDESDETDS